MQLGQKPRSLFCYVCGRQFGTNSLGIHLKNCIKKFKNQQQKKPKAEQRQIPTAPPQLDQVLSGDFSALEIYNEKAINTHKYQVLPSCRFCGRTFNEESLKAHENGCSKKDYKKIKQTESKKYLDNLGDPSKKPRTLVCCICGREFGLSSLKIHYPQCSEKFKNEEKKKPKAERKTVPEYSDKMLDMVNMKQDWTSEEIDQFNQQATGNYRNNAMISCENCQRKFLVDSYPKHKKNCVLIHGKINGMSENPSPTYNIGNSLKKPRTLTCCVCGREFGLTSLKIHYPQCVQKFENEQKLKPISDRKQTPQFSDDQLQMVNNKTDWTIQQIQQFNQHANGNYRENAMTECENCKRKFFAQSYLKHRKNCILINGNKMQNGSSSSTKSMKQAGDSNGFSKKPKVLMCHICGRQFGLTSLKIHLKQCQIKFLNQEKKKPQQSRKSVPKLPENEQFNLQEASTWKIQKIQEYNKIANQIYREESLSACPFCGRKFFQQSLPKHLKHCEKNTDRERGKSQINKGIKSPAKEDYHAKSVGKSLKRKNSLSTFSKKNEENIGNQQQIKDSSEIKKMKSPIQEVDEQEEQQKKNSAKKVSDFVEAKETNEFLDSQKFVDSINQIEEQEEGVKNQIKHPDHQDFKEIKQQAEQLQETQKHIYENQNEQLEKNNQFNPDQDSPLQEKQSEKNEQELSQNQEEGEPIPQKEQIIAEENTRERSSKGFATMRKKEALKLQAMRECSICYRKFDADRIEKHEKICRESEKRSKMLKQNAQSKKKLAIREDQDDSEERRLKNAEQQKLRETLTPTEKVRMGKGFAAPRMKEEKIKKVLAECQHCKSKFPEGHIQEHEKKCIKQNQDLNEKQETVIEEVKSLKRVPCTNCNRKFAQQRLPKHLQVCKPKQSHPFKKKQSKKQENETIYDQQVEGQKNIQKQVLKACQKCGRKFVQSRISRHEEVCKGTKNVQKSQMRIKGPQKKYLQTQIEKGLQIPPQELDSCSKCGRKFAKDRLERHEQICKAVKNISKPKEENLLNLKKMPKQPFKKLTNTENEQKYPLDEKLYEIQTEKQHELVQCVQCGRKFNEDRIQKHSGVCKGKTEKDFTPSKKIQNINQISPSRRNFAKIPPLASPQISENGPRSNQKTPKQQKEDEKYQEEYQEQELVKCSKCERSFNAQRISKHQQICKGNQKLHSKIIDERNRLKEQQLRETKNEFFNLMKDLKQKKIAEDDISKILNEQLEQIQKTQQIGRKQNSKNNVNRSHRKTSSSKKKDYENRNVEKSVVLPKI